MLERVTPLAGDGPGLVTVKVKVPVAPEASVLGPVPLTERSTRNQPMSCRRGTVRSRFEAREGLITGSMRRGGAAEVSQCTSEEPAWTWAGAYIRARAEVSAPA